MAASIAGFARAGESDMTAIPDPSTFQILPWRPRERRVARMFCNVHLPDGSPFAGDPRYVLMRNLERAAALGFTFYVGPEVEYFYFNSSELTEPLDKGGYFDLTPLDGASDLRRETVLTLEEMGIGVESSHHEVAPSQHEVDLRYTDALTMADSVLTCRLVVKEVAMAAGVHATFMPKPMANENGSGMHTHLSLFRGETNAFFDENDPMHLSAVARGFIAGLLRHASEITLVTNQWVNSYKRLVPGFEAPVRVAWNRKNARPHDAQARAAVACRATSSACRSPPARRSPPASSTARRTRPATRTSPSPPCSPPASKASRRRWPPPSPSRERLRDERGGEEGPRHRPPPRQPLRSHRGRRGERAAPRAASATTSYQSLLLNKKIEWENFRTHVTDWEPPLPADLVARSQEPGARSRQRSRS